MSSSEWKNLLKGVYIFQSLNGEELEKIASICKKESFSRGKLIFSEGSFLCRIALFCDIYFDKLKVEVC